MKTARDLVEAFLAFSRLQRDGCKVRGERSRHAVPYSRALRAVVARVTVASVLGSDGRVIGKTSRMCLASISQ
jgi:hypothetical protein